METWRAKDHQPTSEFRDELRNMKVEETKNKEPDLHPQPPAPPSIPPACRGACVWDHQTPATFKENKMKAAEMCFMVWTIITASSAYNLMFYSRV